MADLSLFGSYTHSTYSYLGLILIAVGSYTYRRLILIQILYIFRSPKGHILMFVSDVYLFKSPK